LLQAIHPKVSGFIVFCRIKCWVKIKYMVLYGMKINVGRVIHDFMNYGRIASIIGVCIYLIVI
jgi:hypothetical protein